MRLDDIANLNPPRLLKKGAIAKMIDMAALPTGHRSIELSSIVKRPYSSGARFKNGDSLMARITPCLENGKSAYVNCLSDGEVAAGSTEFIVIAPKRDAEADFVYYASRFPEFRLYAISRMEGTSGRQRVSHHSIADFEFPYIEPDDRVAIGNLLRSLDDRIDNNRALAANLEAIARRLFKSWFVDFDPVRAKATGEKSSGLADDLAALFPDRFEESEFGMFPEGWSVTTLGEAFDLNPKRSLSKGAMAPYLDMANTPTTGHVPDQIIDRAFSSGSKFINGDTLLARITPCLENGKAAFVDFLGDNEVGWGSTEFIVMRPKAKLPGYFGYLLTRYEPFKAHAIASMSGTSGRQRVQPDSLALWELVLPSEAVAMAFGQIVEPLRAAIASANEEIRVLGNIRDLLLPCLISGKLRVADAESLIEEAIA